MAVMYICAYHSEATKLEFCIIKSLYFEVYNNKVKKKFKCLNLCKRVQRAIFTLMALAVCVWDIGIAPTRRRDYQIEKEVEISAYIKS